jgi:16S rRNA (cytidine1402-2'-O)-methyltransferase
LVERLRNGESLALVSDAGTPLLSDPGARLVRAAIDAGVHVSPVPGASALLAALVVSGLETERFTFFGFLARKGPERRTAIEEVVALRHAAILYEAPARVGATLAEVAEAGADGRTAVVARELTKQYEELRRGTVAVLAAYYGKTPPRGEVVIVIAGSIPTGASEDQLRARALALRAEGRSARDIAAALSAELGAPRNLAYRLAHE